MFRDSHLASKEKEISQLRDELAKARANDQEMLDKLEKAERDLQKERAKPKVKRTFKFPSLPSVRIPRFTIVELMIAVMLLSIPAIIGIAIYSFLTDIQEGVVTSKHFKPAHLVCMSNGKSTDCHMVPDHWSVDIAYEGKTATWSVDHEEYDQLDQGEWYCHVDFAHDQSNCKGQPTFETSSD